MKISLLSIACILQECPHGHLDGKGENLWRIFGRLLPNLEVERRKSYAVPEAFKGSWIVYLDAQEEEEKNI